MSYPDNAGYKDDGDGKAMARKIDKCGYTETMRDKVLRVIKSHDSYGATTEEISRILGVYNSTVPARTRELFLGGAIKKSGKFRGCKGNDRLAPVYVATGEPFKPVKRLSKKTRQLIIATKALEEISQSFWHWHLAKHAKLALKEIEELNG